MRKRRTCTDRRRLFQLRELRAWLAEVGRAEQGSSRQSHLVLLHPAVESGLFDYGMSSWATVVLRDGHEIVEGGPGPGWALPFMVARKIYQRLSRKARKGTQA